MALVETLDPDYSHNWSKENWATNREPDCKFYILSFQHGSNFVKFDNFFQNEVNSLRNLLDEEQNVRTILKAKNEQLEIKVKNNFFCFD